MEGLLKLRTNHDLWKSVSEKVRKIGGGVAVSVEESLTSSYIAELQSAVQRETNGAQLNHQRNLQESLDVLHDCLIFDKPGREEVHVAVRQAYLTFCQALLRVEAEEMGKIQTGLGRALEKLSCLPRPLHRHIPQLQDAVVAVKKTAQLMKQRAAAVHCGQEKLLLLTDQTLVCLKLLLITVKDVEISYPAFPQIKAGVGFVLSRLVWCLEEATSDTERDDTMAKCGQFITKMDEAMTMLEAESHTLTGLKELCEDLLGHAMSVAHVALGNDAEHISKASQKVLQKVNNMNEDENPVLKNLRLGVLADALLILEETVNASLLRLVLEVFSEVSAPLNEIFVAGSNEEMDKKVAAFDLHVDRIMQAGMFAIACSSDTPRVVGVRSCLASLESLESELVPAIIARHNSMGTPDENANNMLAHVYSQHWKSEANRLEHLLDQLVDPPAFCKVTSEEIRKLKKQVCGTSDEAQAKLHAEHITSFAFKLHTLLSSLHEQQEPIGCEIGAITDLMFFVGELRAAIFMPGSDKWLHRLRKRSRLLSKAVATISEQMQESLARDNAPQDANTTAMEYEDKDDDDTSQDEDTPSTSKPDTNQPTSDKSDTSEEDKETSKQVFPDSVRDLPMDVTTTPTSPKKRFEMPVYDLTPFLARGKQLCDARSVLYRTPVATPRLAGAPPQIELVEMQNLSEDNAARQLFAPEPTEDVSEDTLMLNITGILEGLTGLSDTLSSEMSALEVQPSRLVRGGKIGASLCVRRAQATSNVSQHSRSCQVSTSSRFFSPSISSQGISTSQRMRDLQQLQTRLASLKKTMTRLADLNKKDKD